MSMVQHFPEQASRVETGAVQFGDDWPGVFIRGDNALFMAGMLEAVLSAPMADPMARAVLRGLASTLKSCDARYTVTDTGRRLLCEKE